MKKRSIRAVLTMVLAGCLLWQTSTQASNLALPTGDPLKEPVIIRATCYTASEGAVCSTGVKPHSGVIAGAKEWEGMAAALYTFEYVNGEPVPKECIGLYTVLDTGAGIDTDGDGKGNSIRDGHSIDVYCNTGTEAEEFVARYGDYVLLMLIPEGDGD